MKKKTTKPEATTKEEQTTGEVFTVKAKEVVAKVKELVKEGNARQIIVEDRKGKVLFTVPVTFGVIGTVLAPWVVGLGAIAAVVGDCTIRVER